MRNHNRRLRFFLLASLLIHTALLWYLSYAKREKPLICAPIEVKLIEKIEPSTLTEKNPKVQRDTMVKIPQGVATSQRFPITTLKTAVSSPRGIFEGCPSSEVSGPTSPDETEEAPLVMKEAERIQESSQEDKVSSSSKTVGANQAVAGFFAYEESQVNERPYFKNLVKPKYPEIARKLGKEGLVVLKVLVDEKGKVKEVQILRFAGFGFDEEAEKAIRQSLFEPAKIQGQPVPCYVKVPVRFVLEGE